MNCLGKVPDERATGDISEKEALVAGAAAARVAARRQYALFSDQPRAGASTGGELQIAGNLCWQPIAFFREWNGLPGSQRQPGERQWSS